jgi:hypothetical protein
MKLRSPLGGLVAAAACLSCATPALAANHANILVEQARTVEGGRAVDVLVAQAELKSNINPSQIVVATGGGLLGAIIDAAVDAERAKKAEKAIAPMREALTGYDVDGLAVSTTKATLEKVGWFQSPASSFNRDTSILALNAVLDASQTPQTALVEYVYDTSPDFASIRVAMTVRFVTKVVPTGKKPESRLSKPVYAQTVTSVMNLSNPSKDAEENAARWSADGGKLARQALAADFEEDAALMQQAINLQEGDVKTMNAREHKMKNLCGFAGRLQEDGPNGALLFNGGLVRVRTLGS